MKENPHKDAKNEEKELLHFKRKKLVKDLVQRLSEDDDNFYYYPTVEVAALILEYRDQGKISLEERSLIEDLDLGDIQVLLSHKN